MLAPAEGQPNWDQALCRNYDPDLFFTAETEQLACAVCVSCPIRWECLSWALTVGEAYGVWGGMPEDQRRNVKFKRHRVKCPYCGCTSVDTGSRPRTEICRSCGLSWLV